MALDFSKDSSPIAVVQVHLSALSAAQAAEFFISPWVDKKILLQATEESGPSLWIVNRSDVYDATLEKMLEHRLTEIASRARAKLSQRHNSLNPLEPPVLEVPLETIPDREAEDVLGHPLCSFEAILHFSKSLNEDNRGSSALSLTRRLLEHAPNWTGYESIRELLRQRFAEMIISDHSAYVRMYAARVPLLQSSDLSEALKKETHPLVLARLLQNPATAPQHLSCVCEGNEDRFKDETVQAVLAADERLNSEQRQHLMQTVPENSLAHALHRLMT